MSEWQIIGLLDDHPDLTQRAAKRRRDLRVDADARRELGPSGLRKERRVHERDECELPGLGAGSPTPLARARYRSIRADPLDLQLEVDTAVSTRSLARLNAHRSPAGPR